MSREKILTAVLVFFAILSVGVMAYNLYVLASGKAPKAPAGLHIQRKG